ncbi:hypothetical protein L6452_12867 [Arctium lappa]|uniref:Uncharacterized protein n=1 Tax=Arctium lappa TaxID=4217 RepID=A0ACB9CGK0_ARCLA|nr:hypothetical protein L6452_12867 [Arctium lappa]
MCTCSTIFIHIVNQPNLITLKLHRLRKSKNNGRESYPTGTLDSLSLFPCPLSSLPPPYPVALLHSQTNSASPPSPSNPPTTASPPP